MVAGPEITDHGLQLLNVAIFLGAIPRWRRAVGSSGKPSLPRGCASGCTSACTWEHRGCVRKRCLSEHPDRPVVCFDESPTQLIGEVRTPIPAKPGQIERYDCEYRRNGTANLFVFVDVHRPWRKVKVTESRTAVDFAACMRELADIHFPKAERIRVVLDNRPTRPARSTKRSRLSRPDGCCVDWNSTMSPSMPVG
jgi:hypothetical protein